jgi:hypothetical protein
MKIDVDVNVLIETLKAKNAELMLENIMLNAMLKQVEINQSQKAEDNQ